MKAKSIKGSSTEEIQTALAESMAEGFKPTLAFVFCSVAHDYKVICKLFDLQEIKVFGATSSGEIYDDTVTHQGISVLLTDLHPSNFQLQGRTCTSRAIQVLMQAHLAN